MENTQAIILSISELTTRFSMKIHHFLIIGLVLCSLLNATAQPAHLNEFDKERFNEVSLWLEERLEINYFNPESNLYWANRFFFNTKSQTFSLRSISTSKPNSSSKKKVIDRTVKPENLDVSSIVLTKVEENRGRIVAGTSIEIHTIGQERTIQRSFDGHPSLKESMLEIPIPQHYEDSVLHFSTEVKDKIIELIELSTKVYPSTTPQQNLLTLLDALSGTFRGSDGSIRKFSPIQGQAVDSDEYMDDEHQLKEILGYDANRNVFFRWTVGPHGSETKDLKVDTSKELMFSTESGSYKLTLYGTHKFSIEKGGRLVKYYRSSF